VFYKDPAFEAFAYPFPLLGFQIVLSKMAKNEQGYFKMLVFPPGSVSNLYDRQALEMTVVHNSEWQF
jgi:hypothetical protein